MPCKIQTCQLLLLAICTLFSACSDGPAVEESAVYVSIEDYTHQFEPGSTASLPVKVSTSGKKGWAGSLAVQVVQNDSVLNKVEQAYEVAKAGEQTQTISLVLPQQEGDYELVAELIDHYDHPIRSRRLIEIKTPIRIDLN